MCVWLSFQTKEALFAVLRLTFYVNYKWLLHLMTIIRSVSDSTWVIVLCWVLVIQGLPTCGTRTTGGTRRSSRWYASNFHFFTKTWMWTVFEFTCRALFLKDTYSCSLLFLLYHNIMTFDALLANLRHASTHWRKVNKNKNLINLVVVFYCYFNVYYSSE